MSCILVDLACRADASVEPMLRGLSCVNVKLRDAKVVF